MPGTSARTSRNGAVASISMMRSHIASAVLSSAALSAMPALLTRISICGSSATMRSVAVRSATSQTTACPPISSATASRSAFVSPHTITCAPARASERSHAAPIPRPPPVTSACFPASCCMRWAYHVRHCAGMRRALVLLVMMACGKGKSAPSQGSALPAPQQKLMDAVADGVFEPPHVIDASIPDAAAPDAAVATGATLSNKDGLSTLGKLLWNKQDETATAELIQKKIGLPGVRVSFDVMDVPGEVETEEGYWSVKRGDKEIIQVLRASQGPDEGPAAVVIWTPEIATTDGIKVGSTVGDLLAKHADIACH